MGPVGRIAAKTVDYLFRKSPVRALRAHTAVERLSRKNFLLSEEVFERIRRDEHFYRFLQQ